MKQRTDLYCHNCTGHFVAKIDYDIDGEHIIECPHCGHEHCRVIEAGNVTGDRWSGRNETVISVEKRNVVPLKNQIGVSVSESHFLRELWIDRIS